ncbi:MAG: hypothetical protein JW959_14165 [Pirellulales bacterium]|nr:hypothetical protein [Pirellulales bacterium]
MNSKQRVQAAIARKPVDKVPLGFFAVDYDTVERVLGRPTYVRNKIAIQIALWEGRREEVAESLKADTVEFYRKIDCADLLLPKEALLLPPKDYVPDPPKKIAPDKWEDRRGCIYQAVELTNEIQCIFDPMAGKRQFRAEDFEGFPEVHPPDPSVFEAFDYLQEQLGRDRYIASPSGGITGGGVVAMESLGGIEQGLFLYASQPEVIAAFNRRTAAVQDALDQYYIRGECPGVIIEEDTAGTRAPLISPKMFRELVFPFFRQRVQHIKRFVPQVILHNCGQNMPLMEMFIEAGVACYQSLQTTAGMEIGLLKERFGDRLCFWGGMPVETLITGTPDDVRRDVRTALRRGAPGGGFIFGPSHSVAKGTKYENFMTMLDEFVELRDKV